MIKTEHYLLLINNFLYFYSFHKVNIKIFYFFKFMDLCNKNSQKIYIYAIKIKTFQKPFFYII